MARKKQRFDLGKEVRKLARERVGQVPAEQIIPTKADRKPKHKKRPDLDGSIDTGPA